MSKVGENVQFYFLYIYFDGQQNLSPGLVLHICSQWMFSSPC